MRPKLQQPCALSPEVTATSNFGYDLLVPTHSNGVTISLKLKTLIFSSHTIVGLFAEKIFLIALIGIISFQATRFKKVEIIVISMYFNVSPETIFC